MPWYIHTDDDGNQTKFWSDEEIETDDEEADDDDEDSEDEADDDDEDEADDGDVEEEASEAEESNKDTPEQYARVEAFYNAERAAIRRIDDAAELRLKRQSYENALQTPNPSQIGLMRVRDLLRLVEQRELDLRAKRLADRKR